MLFNKIGQPNLVVYVNYWNKKGGRVEVTEDITRKSGFFWVGFGELRLT